MKWWIPQLSLAVPTILILVLQNKILLSVWCVLLLVFGTADSWLADRYKHHAETCLKGWKSAIEQNGGGE